MIRQHHEIRCFLLWVLSTLGAVDTRAAPTTEEWSASVADLFSAEEARDIAPTMATDKPVNFRVRIPKCESACGVLVFVKPTPIADLSHAWVDLLDARKLIWVSADGFGNKRPTAQRVVMTMMAVKLATSRATLDPRRTYVAGMSGGGRIASQVITRFPETFSGAILIVGADYFMPGEPLKSQLQARPIVFITGDRDFNHGEMLRVFARYQEAGLQRTKLMDIPRFGHQNPSAAELAEALDFLDAR